MLEYPLEVLNIYSPHLVNPLFRFACLPVDKQGIGDLLIKCVFADDEAARIESQL